MLLLLEPLKHTKKSMEKEDLMTKKSNEIIELNIIIRDRSIKLYKGD